MSFRIKKQEAKDVAAVIREIVRAELAGLSHKDVMLACGEFIVDVGGGRFKFAGGKTL